MKSKITTVALILLTYLNVSGQKSEFVKSDSIIYPIHKSNIGKQLQSKTSKKPIF